MEDCLENSTLGVHAGRANLQKKYLYLFAELHYLHVHAAVASAGTTSRFIETLQSFSGR